MRKHLVVWQKVPKKPILKRYINQELENQYEPEVCESDNPYYIEENKELQNRVIELCKKAKKELSKQEWKVFNLLTGWQGAPPMTQKDAALKLGLTQGRVSQIWETVRKQLCEEWEK